MGVMTAAEANRARVTCILFAEREQMLALFTPEDKECPVVNEAKPPMSETGQLWTSGASHWI
jgi:hypothetical protein